MCESVSSRSSVCGLETSTTTTPYPSSPFFLSLFAFSIAFAFFYPPRNIPVICNIVTRKTKYNTCHGNSPVEAINTIRSNMRERVEKKVLEVVLVSARIDSAKDTRIESFSIDNSTETSELSSDATRMWIKILASSVTSIISYVCTHLTIETNW